MMQFSLSDLEDRRCSRQVPISPEPWLQLSDLRETAENICVEASAEGIVQCANFNSPGQIVISGSVAGVQKGMELAKAAKARLVSQLTVSGAFHSPLMQSAKDQLGLKLNSFNFYDTKFPVYANATAKPQKEKDEIKNNLFLQVTCVVGRYHKEHDSRWI